MNQIEKISIQLEHALLSLDQETATRIIKEAQSESSPGKIAGDLISSTLVRIGDSWESGNLTLSQVYMSGVICEKVIDKFLPPQSPIRKSQPKMAIGCASLEITSGIAFAMTRHSGEGEYKLFKQH